MFIPSSSEESCAHTPVCFSYQHVQTRQLALEHPRQAFQERKRRDQRLLLFVREVIGKGLSKSLLLLASCAMNSLESCLGE